MQGTRLSYVLRESLGNIFREIKVALTPVPRPDKWLFLVGCYNSGTTLLAEILGRHPDISGLPTEGHFITDQFVKDFEVGLPRMWAGREELFRLTETDDGPDPIRIKKEWGMRLDLTRPVLLEKSPPNSVRTRWLNQHFIPAYFVAIVRNGYAVAEGISRKGDPKHLRDGWPVEQSAWQWRRTNEVLEEDATYLPNFMWLKYEDLVCDPLTELNRIASFVGLRPFDGFDSGKDFSIHERKESLKDLNAESICRLTPGQINLINSVAKGTLTRFGYPLLPRRA
ncbi:MAG: sulfotransferase [Desulfobulbaceae bacterium]|nr:sulfotransferase [Desulfobulbaceae bacterium]